MTSPAPVSPLCRLALVAIVAIVATVAGVAGCADSAQSLAFATPSIVVDAEAGTALPVLTAQGKKGPVPLEGAVTYTVEPAAVAEVVNGRVVPAKNGKATVTAHVADPAVAPATLAVVVQLIDRLRITCPVTPCVARTGDTVALAAEVTGLGAPVDVPVTWTVDKPELATIDGSTIKAIAAGTVVVKATAGSVTSEQPIAIRAPVRAVRLFCLDPFVVSSAERGTAPTAPLLACHLKNGLPTRIDVEVLVGDTPSDGEEVEWSASDSRVAVVTAGEVRGMAPGLTLVRATIDGVTAEMAVEVAADDRKRKSVVCGEDTNTWRHDVSFTAAATIAADGTAVAGVTTAFRCEAPDAQGCLDTTIKSIGAWLSPGATTAAAKHCCCRPVTP